MITQRAQLFYSLIDGSESIGNMSFWLKDGVDPPSMEPVSDTMRGLIAACSDAAFIRQSIVFSAVESPRPEAGAGADSTRVGALIFSCDTDELCLVEIHGIKDEFLLTTGPGAGVIIDQANTTIASLVDEIIGGIWVNPFALDITALESAYLQIRR